MSTSTRPNMQVGDVFVGVDQNQFSQEFQPTYSGERLSGVAGLYYLREDIGSHQEAYGNDLFGLAGVPIFRRCCARSTTTLTTKSYAAYANGSFEIVPTVRLSAGVRYTRESKDYFRTTSAFLNGALAATALPVRRQGHVERLRRRWPASTGRLMPSTMLYARVAKGFKSGGFNGRANSASPKRTEYQPETVWSYEARLQDHHRQSAAAERRRLLATTIAISRRASRHRHRPGRRRSVPRCRCSTPASCAFAAPSSKRPGLRRRPADRQPARLSRRQVQGFADPRFSRRQPRLPDAGLCAEMDAAARRAICGFDLGGAGSITVGGQSRYKSRTALAVDNTLSITRTSSARVGHDHRSRRPVPERLLARTTHGSSGKCRASISRSASTATI